MSLHGNNPRPIRIRYPLLVRRRLGAAAVLVRVVLLIACLSAFSAQAPSPQFRVELERLMREGFSSMTPLEYNVAQTTSSGWR